MFPRSGGNKPVGAVAFIRMISRESAQVSTPFAQAWMPKILLASAVAIGAVGAGAGSARAA